MKTRFTPNQEVFISKQSYFRKRGCTKGIVSDFNENQVTYKVTFLDGDFKDDWHWVNDFDLFSKEEWRIESTIDRDAFDAYTKQVTAQKKMRDDVFKAILGIVPPPKSKVEDFPAGSRVKISPRGDIDNPWYNWNENHSAVKGTYGTVKRPDRRWNSKISEYEDVVEVEFMTHSVHYGDEFYTLCFLPCHLEK